jgi:hypothetical protein
MGMTTPERMTEMMVGLEVGRQMVDQMRQQAATLPPGAPVATQPHMPYPPVPPVPPLPEGIWYASINGKQAGPFKEDEVHKLISGGKITRQSLVWRQGMTAWAAAEDTPEILRIFVLDGK